jgi:hypothetical protein
MPDESQETGPKSEMSTVLWGVLSWFAANPLVGFVSFVVGIVSLAATFYFGVESLHKRDLRLYVSPVRTLIARSGRTSDLRVLYKGQLVSTDVTALQVGLWNEGNESIKPEHVLEPIILQTVPQVPILEAKLHYVSRNITNVSLDTTHLADGTVGINWRILEHNDGAVIQLIIAGPFEEGIIAKGSLEGQSTISTKPASLRVPLLVSIAITLIFVLSSVRLMRQVRMTPRPAMLRGIPQRTLIWKTLAFGVAMIGLQVYLIFFIRQGDSPGPLQFDTTMTDDRPFDIPATGPP